MKNVIRHVIAFLAVLLCTLGFIRLARYMAVNDSHSVRRLTINEYYDQDNIDILFAGSSQVFNSIDTQILDEKLGKNTYALGTSSQRLNLTRFLVKDAIGNNDLEHVYVYLGYKQGRYTRPKYSDLSNIYVATDYIRPSLDKYLFLMEVSEPDQYANNLMPARRGWTNLFDPEKVGKTLREKASEEYRSLDYDMVRTDTEYYAGKGHVAGTKVVEDGTMIASDGAETLRLNRLTDCWKENVLSIIEICEKEGVALTFFAPPISSCLLAAWENYDEFIDYVNELISGHDVEFVDFSLLREEYWPDTSTLYLDDIHLNEEGSRLFSGILADYLAGDLAAEDIFYSSVEERLAASSPAFYGITIRDLEDEEVPSKEYRLIANRDTGMEFQVELYPENGQAEELQSFSDNRVLTLPADKKGTLRISMRLTDGSDLMTVSCIDI